MKKIIFAAAAVACLCARAAAFHPLVSEDTGFLGKGGRQVEAGYEYSVSRDGADTFSSALAAELSYGLSDTADLLLSVPWQAWSSAGVSESGAGDIAVEAKFRAAEKAGWVFAVKPGFSVPSGDEERGLGSGKSAFWAYAIAGRTAGPWQFCFNAGYFLNKNSGGEEEHILKGSAAAALEAAPGTFISADLTNETSAAPASSRHPLSVIFGVVRSVSANLDIDAGARFGLNSAADDLALLAGCTFRF